MTTTIPAKSLSTALAACAHCIGHDPARWNVPPLTLARTQSALLVRTGTRSGDVGITFRIPCETGGEWTVEIAGKDVKKLAKTLKTTGSRKSDTPPVQIEHAGLHLVFLAGPQRISVPVMQVDETPEPVRTVGHYPVVPGGDLADRLGAAMSWCGTGPGRELVSGVHAYIRSRDTGIDVPVIAVTDGHRLLLDGDIEKTTELPDVFRFPAESWAAASKAMATRFNSVEYVHEVHGREDIRDVPPSDRTYLVFSGDDRVVRLRIERPSAALPNWKSLVTPVDGEHDLDVVVDRDRLARVARSASGIGSGSNRNCSIHEGTDGRCIRIRAEGTGGSMEEVVGAEIRSAPETSVFLNAAYLEDALEAVRSMRVRIIQHDSPLGAVQLTETSEVEWTSRTILVMPVRGSEKVEVAAPEDEVPTGMTVDEPSDEPEASAAA